jgi:predicted ferric reductase
VNEVPLLWILARASGFAAYALLTVGVLAGLLLATRPLARLLGPAIITEVHRTLSLAALGMLVLHMTTIALDTTTNFTVADLVVPGHASYRPLWTALGVVAAELMLVIHVSFRLRTRIGVRAWRLLHRFALAVFAMATAHGLMAGSDSGASWAQLAYLVAATSVSGAVVWRIRESHGSPARTDCGQSDMRGATR